MDHKAATGEEADADRQRWLAYLDMTHAATAALKEQGLTIALALELLLTVDSRKPGDSRPWRLFELTSRMPARKIRQVRCKPGLKPLEVHHENCLPGRGLAVAAGGRESPGGD